MSNEIDDLMDLDPLLLSEQNLDAIIAYQRKYRANLETGGPKLKRGQTKAAAKIDLSALITKPTAPAGSGIKRRL